ncbi:hypothetical protein Aau02nite_28390 [Amorphoplanes auranticolor]|uniref:Uncharacterized protein n=1 Tax=Actinoplanes auranticolor TaxID=47988 RepID=A0A919S8T7_9ACTN|nr:hypothetical protein Aau02nite_28390 [Actinoplanes auranticolor]
MRTIVPADRRAAVQDLLTGNDAVTHVVVLPGAAVEPVGDLVSCDVVREGASAIIGRLRDLGVERDGSILLEKVDTTLSAAADRAERRVPGLRGGRRGVGGVGRLGAATAHQRRRDRRGRCADVVRAAVRRTPPLTPFRPATVDGHTTRPPTGMVALPPVTSIVVAARTRGRQA